MSILGVIGGIASAIGGIFSKKKSSDNSDALRQIQAALNQAVYVNTQQEKKITILTYSIVGIAGFILIYFFLKVKK